MEAAVLLCSCHTRPTSKAFPLLLFCFHKQYSVHVCVTRRCGVRADEKNGNCWSPVDQKVAPLLCSSQRNTQITQNPTHGLWWPCTLDHQTLTAAFAAGLTTPTSKQLLSLVVGMMSTRCEQRETAVKLWWSLVYAHIRNLLTQKSAASSHRSIRQR